MKSLNKPKVAIVIPTFNRRDFVQKAIDSSLAQTYPCEVVVCDHGSSDDTPKVMKKYGNKIKYVRKEEDFGPHFCWLDGLLHTDAEFVHLQFDDDWISDDYIEKCMKLMRKDVGVVIADAYGMFKFKKMFGKSGIYPKKKLERKLLTGAMYSPGASLFRRKDLIDALYLGELPLAKYPAYHGVGPDSFMTLLAVLRYKNIGIITESLVFLREHSDSITCDAYSDSKKYIRFRNAYENVTSYYMFLKWFWLFDKFKYISPRFWVREIKRILRVTLKNLGLFDSARNIMKKMTRLKGEIKTQSTSTRNNQKQNVPGGVSHSDTLRTTLTASSDTDALTNPSLDEVSRNDGRRINPQDCSGSATGTAKEDTNKSVLPADSKLPKGFKKGKCKCGNSYGYCGLDIGYCVKCIDKMETKE